MVARWDDTGTVIPAGEAKYTVAEQPIAEYDNWINYNLVTDMQAVIDDVINKFNANTILKADSDNTPTSLAVAVSTFVGRKAAGSIAALTATEARTVLNVENGSTADQSNAEIRAAVEAATDSNVFTDADHAIVNDAVIEATFNANTILKANSDNTPLALTVAEQRLVGRITAGVITALTAAQVRTMINVADGADVTADNAPQAHHTTHELGGSDVVAGLGITLHDVQVFSGTCPTTMTDLDLSSEIGAVQTIVALGIKRNAGGDNVFVRRNGDTGDYSSSTGSYHTGVQSCLANAEMVSVLIVMTDTAGVVEWMADISNAFTIQLLWSLR